MTGQKDRSKTTDKLWDLDDKQLKTPKHDELVLSVTPEFILFAFPESFSVLRKPESWSWIYDKEVISENIAKQRGFQRLKSTGTNKDFTILHVSEKGDIYFGCDYEPSKKPVRRLYYSSLDPHDQGSYGPVLWEDTETSEEVYWRIIRDGYSVTSKEIEKCRVDHLIDLAVWEPKEQEKKILRDRDIALLAIATEKEIERSKRLVEYYKEFCNDIIPKIDLEKLISINHEVPIIQSYNKFVVGFWDIVIRLPFSQTVEVVFSNGQKYTTECLARIQQIFIEVKPVVDSYGTTIRQINLYGLHVENNRNICLLTPDTRFKKAFESQGIRVISP